MLQAVFSSGLGYALDMPNRLQLEGDPAATVPVQVRMPLWAKQRAVELAKERGKTLKDWINDLIFAAIDAAPPRTGSKKR